jgi:hypothetical protein
MPEPGGMPVRVVVSLMRCAVRGLRHPRRRSFRMRGDEALMYDCATRSLRPVVTSTELGSAETW